MFPIRTRAFDRACIAGAVILISLHGWAGRCDEKVAPLDAKLKAVLDATNRPDASAAYNSLFADGELEKLCVLDDDRFKGIALRSNWEKVIRSVPERTQDQIFDIDRSRLARFLGFCEGRLKLSLPSWWEQTVLSAKAHGGRESIQFTLPEQCSFDFNKNGISTPKNVKLTVGVNSSTLTEGEDEILLPDRILDHAKSVRGTLVPVFGKETVIIASHIGFCSPFEAFLIDRKTKETKWSCYVWGTGSGWGGTPIWGHFVSMQISQSQLTVFGAGPYCAYIEAFAITDGKLLYRFSTSY